MSSSFFTTRPHTFAEHKFRSFNYKYPTYCAHCTKLLVGIVKQGYKCKRCCANVHKRCIQEFMGRCIEVIAGNHNFREKTYTSPTYCDYCGKLLYGVLNQGIQCTECKTNVHQKCQEKIEVTCQEVKCRLCSERSKSQGSAEQSLKVGKSGIASLSSSTSALDEEGSPLTNNVFPTSQKKRKQIRRSEGIPCSTDDSDNSLNMSRSKSLPSTVLESQVEEVAAVMQMNVNKLREREDRLETLQCQSELLEEKTKLFQNKTKDLKKKYWWHNKKFWIILLIAIIIIVIIIVVVVMFAI